MEHSLGISLCQSLRTSVSLTQGLKLTASDSQIHCSMIYQSERSLQVSPCYVAYLCQHHLYSGDLNPEPAKHGFGMIP
eukprot:13888738-Ditylum_brightwellii.AAC.1